VIVLVEGWAAAGKGSLINELIREIDPRFFGVVSPVLPPETEDRYPFLYRYAREIPENGKIMFYDSGWMEGAVRRYLRREITEKEFRAYVRSVTEFERQLRDSGYLVIKLFLHIDKGEQRDRIRALKENYETEWRVTEEDIWQHREYKLFLEAYDSFMEMTDKPVSWHILDGSRKKPAALQALRLLVEAIEEGLEKGRCVGEPFEEKMARLTGELAKCFEESDHLQRQIRKNLDAIGFGF
jgi:polyphosphate kinase 2 (PPK2 family)